MTAPVTVEPQSNKISMTAPVTVEPLNEGPNLQQAQQWRVNFFMPSKYTLANIAKPKNEIVKLKELPSRHFLVLAILDSTHKQEFKRKRMKPFFGRKRNH